MLSLHQEVVRGLTQSTTADADADDAAAIQARNVTIRQTLRERLGEAVAADVIDRTQRFIENNSELEQLVNRGRSPRRPSHF
jgi:hypothetical protein